MITADTALSGPGEWRAKYLACVRELDQLERSFRDSERALHRSILRLTHLAADRFPPDPDAENPLETVLAMIRSRPSAAQLEKKIREVSSAMRAAESPCRATSQLLHQLALTITCADQSQDQGLATIEPRNCADNAQLLRRLLDGLHQASAQSERIDTAHEQERLTCLETMLEQIAESGGLDEEGAAELAELRNLIAQARPGESDPNPNQSQSLALILPALSRFVANIHLSRTRSQHATEQFLNRLSARLLELDQFFRGLTQRDEEAAADSSDLGSRVMQEVQAMARMIDASPDLASARNGIDGLLDNMQTHLEWFQQQARERQAQHQEVTGRLMQRIKHLEQATSALQTSAALARQDALSDPLTGLHNRRALDAYLEQEYQRWRRTPSPLSVIFTDIDHFKRINDTWGHKAGDQALKSVAALLGSELRRNDYLARYGGEEFVIVLPDTTAQAALLAAEKIRRKIAATRFHFRGAEVGITISCGISSLQATDTFDDCLKRADQALYAAKAQGRNRSLIAP